MLEWALNADDNFKRPASVVLMAPLIGQYSYFSLFSFLCHFPYLFVKCLFSPFQKRRDRTVFQLQLCPDKFWNLNALTLNYGIWNGFLLLKQSPPLFSQLYLQFVHLIFLVLLHVGCIKNISHMLVIYFSTFRECIFGLFDLFKIFLMCRLMKNWIEWMWLYNGQVVLPQVYATFLHRF